MTRWQYTYSREDLLSIESFVVVALASQKFDVAIRALEDKIAYLREDAIEAFDEYRRFDILSAIESIEETLRLVNKLYSEMTNKSVAPEYRDEDQQENIPPIGVTGITDLNAQERWESFQDVLDALVRKKDTLLN